MNGGTSSRLRNSGRALFVAVCVFVGSTENESLGARPPGPGPPDHAYYRSIDFAKSLVKAPLRQAEEKEKWVELEFDQLPRDILSFMKDCTAWRVRPAADPHKAEDLRVRVRAAEDPSQDDLVEYVWTFRGQRLRWVATTNALRLEIDLDALGPAPGETRVESAKSLVDEVMRLTGTTSYDEDYEVELPWPDHLADGVTFSSNPDKTLNALLSWHQRVDAYVEGNTLAILTYRKVAQKTYYKDGAKWFPAEFHKEVFEASSNDPALVDVSTSGLFRAALGRSCQMYAAAFVDREEETRVLPKQKVVATHLAKMQAVAKKVLRPDFCPANTGVEDLTYWGMKNGRDEEIATAFKWEEFDVLVTYTPGAHLTVRLRASGRRSSLVAVTGDDRDKRMLDLLYEIFRVPGSDEATYYVRGKDTLVEGVWVFTCGLQRRGAELDRYPDAKTALENLRWYDKILAMVTHSSPQYVVFKVWDPDPDADHWATRPRVIIPGSTSD